MARSRRARPGHLAHHSPHGLRQGAHAAILDRTLLSSRTGHIPLQHWSCGVVLVGLQLKAHLFWGCMVTYEAAGARR